MSDKFNLLLENKFRGSRDEIKNQLQRYLEPVAMSVRKSDNRLAVDIGCGRGEWLEMLSGEGYDAIGFDLDPEMVKLCREMGLKAEVRDALDYFRELDDNSVGIVTAFHLAEHIEHELFLVLLSEIYRVLADGGMLIMETPNPENLIVSSSQFYLDPAHKTPIPPDLMETMLESTGFQQTVISRVPYGQRKSDKSDVYQYLIWASYEYQNYASISEKSLGGELMPLERFATDRVVYFDAVINGFENVLWAVDNGQKERERLQGEVDQLNASLKEVQDKLWHMNLPWYRRNRLVGKVIHIKNRLKLALKHKLRDTVLAFWDRFEDGFMRQILPVKITRFLDRKTKEQALHTPMNSNSEKILKDFGLTDGD